MLNAFTLHTRLHLLLQEMNYITTKSTDMNIRIEPHLKNEAEAIFDELGLTLEGKAIGTSL